MKAEQLVRKKEPLFKEKYEGKKISNAEWIKKKAIHDYNTYSSLIKKLDEGEAQAITLSIELHSDYLLIDEKKGRTVAHQMGIQTIGLIGTLIKCKENNHIQKLKPVLDELRFKAKFRMSDELYNNVLTLS